jgi:hypothetical protein
MTPLRLPDDWLDARVTSDEAPATSIVLAVVFLSARAKKALPFLLSVYLLLRHTLYLVVLHPNPESAATARRVCALKDKEERNRLFGLAERGSNHRG